MVKNLPCKARYVGSIPGQVTKNPNTTGQMSPCGTNTEPMQACKLQQERSQPTYRMKDPHAVTKIRHRQINDFSFEVVIMKATSQEYPKDHL